MLGVVLWSDAENRRAVFWCEDQGDLAYFEATPQSISTDAFFDAGDMVQFKIKMERKLRRALEPLLVQEHAYCGLSESLSGQRSGADPVQNKPKSAQIIAFDPRGKGAASPLSAIKA